MSMLLQIILSISVVTITAFLVMLLIQARHTAASVQRFADSATQDLHLVAKDVHELRMRADEVAQLALKTFGEPSLLTQVIAGIVSGFPGAQGHQSGAGKIIETLLTGLHTVLHLFRGRKAQRPKEEPHE